VEGDPIDRVDPAGLSYCDMLKDATKDMDCNQGGGSSWNCELDGVPTPCDMVYRFQSMGAAITVQQSLIEKFTDSASLAKIALLDKPSCGNLFQLPGGETAWTLLTSDPRLQITFGPEFNNQINATTTGLPASGSATINFNTDPGSQWLYGTTAGHAQTIIHELLHAAVDIFGLSAVDPRWVQNDLSSAAAQNSNFTLIALLCL
jgi:hypothetical protein